MFTIHSVPESNKQLKKICQRPDSIHRYFSLPITRFILTFNLMTPTQITVFDFFIGLVGVMLLFIGKDWSFVIGTIFLQLFEIFDCVDGEVARYRMYKGQLRRTKAELRVNEFVQDIIHPILQPLMYLGFGYGLFVNYNLPVILLLSYAAAIGTSVDTYINTIREKLIGSTTGIRNVSRAYKEMKAKSENLFRFIPFGQFVVDTMTFITPIPGVIIILNIATILDLFFFPELKARFLCGFPFNFKTGVLIFYAFLQQLLWFLNAKQSIIFLQKK